MSKSLNSISLTGHLCADPKLHAFDDGTEVANLRLAVNGSKKVDGEWQDDPLFIDVKAYGGQVQAIGTYLAKGSFVAVCGRLGQPREWADNNGSSRFTMVVERADVTFGPRTDGGGGEAPPRQATQQKAAAPTQQSVEAADFDTIPF